MDLIRLTNVGKQYILGSIKVHALRNVSINLQSGQYLGIMGPSGSGKSTLMNIIGCLDPPSFGEYFLDGSNVANLKEWELAAVRNAKIGFVFQTFNLLARQTALENVELPMLYGGLGKKIRRIRAIEALERVGLGDRINHQPNQLSGGQRQRVAVARALVNNPSLILADEPTGNLDSKSGEEIMALFQELNNQGHTVLLVTHEENVARYAQSIIRFKDGEIVATETVANRR